MPWFPEIVLNGHTSTAVDRSWQIVPFYKGILDLSSEALLASWSGEPRVDDPRQGEVRGRSEFVDYVRTTREWLALGDATVQPVSVLHTATRSVEEVVLDLTVGGERQELPVAVVAEWDAEHRLTWIRVYHSLWPLFANHHVHTPVIEPHPDVTLPPLVARNQQARAAEDVDEILQTYEDGAVVRTASAAPQLSGGSRLHHGKEELRRLYAGQSVAGTKPRVTICDAVDDGHACAVEYQVTHFSAPKPDQMGVTVYERGASGRISAERSYLVSCPAGQGADEAAFSVGGRG